MKAKNKPTLKLIGKAATRAELEALVERIRGEAKAGKDGRGKNPGKPNA